MFKAKALAGDGRTILMLGLSEMNVRRLKADQPIFFDTAQLHIQPGETVGHVCIFYGKDEASLAKAMGSLIGPETEVFTIPAPTKGTQ